MFKNLRPDADHISIDTAPHADLRQEDDDLYFRCLKCGGMKLVEAGYIPDSLGRGVIDRKRFEESWRI